MSADASRWMNVPRWVRGAENADAIRSASDTVSLIENWMRSEALFAIVDSFGGAVPELELRRRLEWLDDFSAAHWDFRRGRERNLAVDAALTPLQSEIALACGARLGLASSRPQRTRYDVVLLTGGMVRAGVVKPRYAAELRASGIECESVVFLGAFRPFGGDEADVAAALGIQGDDEVDAMSEGLVRQFGQAGSVADYEEIAEHPFASWRRRVWRGADGLQLGVVAAPSSEPTLRRANTADTFRFWAEQVREPHETSVLVITTPIYVPYQAACAVDVLGLGYNISVDTVGVSDTAADLGHLSQRFEPQHYLQEIRSAIRGYRTLIARIDEWMAQQQER